VADQQDGFLRMRPGSSNRPSQRDAAFAAAPLSFVILIAGAHAGREAPLGVRDISSPPACTNAIMALFTAGVGSRGDAIDHRLEVGE